MAYAPRGLAELGMRSGWLAFAQSEDATRTGQKQASGTHESNVHRLLTSVSGGARLATLATPSSQHHPHNPPRNPTRDLASRPSFAVTGALC